jgi:manganese transport protein
MSGVVVDSASINRVEHHGESLMDVRGTVAIPEEGASFWKNWRAFVGPALLVSVGYMDPGNWSTDLSAGAEYRYGLLWVVALSSMMAIILQICAAKLGVVTGKDLARASRDFFPKWTRVPNWLATEVAIAACDLAEVLGSAVAINLLSGTLHKFVPWSPEISILVGVIITAFDVMLLMALQGLGFRKIESFILVLVATIAGCYFTELFVFGHAHQEMAAIGAAMVRPGFPPVPREGATASLALAIGIIGATVMPHNLYLHSALVQTRKLQKNDEVIKRAIKFNAIDAIVALSLAFLVNASILILAAVTFHGKIGQTMADGTVLKGDDWIQEAYHTLGPLLGTTAASVLFAVALLASGQSSTITGTLAGQIVMEGFMSWKVRPWLRRLVTRMVAIVPAVVVIGIYGDRHVTDLLNLSQVILGIQLPFAMIPLMMFTSRRKFMGRFVNGWFLKSAGWTAVVLITALDIYCLYDLVVGKMLAPAGTPQ